jgi:NADH dehydrogenase
LTSAGGTHDDFDVVTGAFGQTGHAIATRLLAAGRPVRTITRAPASLDTTGQVPVIAPTFDDAVALTASLRGCRVLYSAIWTRFGRRGSYDPIVRDIATLFDCARAAGVERIVKVTVATRPDALDLPYWAGKAHIEAALGALGVPHSILRPALIFSADDTVINNVAWAIRHLHVVPVPRGNECRVRPVSADDLAALAVRHGSMTGDRIVDAIGPESLPFVDILRTLRDAMGVRAAFPRVPKAGVHLGSRLLAPLLRDTLISDYELQGLVRGLADVEGAATCPTRFTQWAKQHGGTLGREYHSQRRRSRAREWPGRFAA